MPQRRKSIEELKSNGTFSPHRAKDVPAGLSLLTLPPPPFKLANPALTYYNEEGQNLIELGMLKNSDLITLAQYANEVAIYVQASTEASNGGLVVELSNGMSAQNQYRKIAADALKNSMALADRLGLSPKGRHTMKGPAAFDTPPDLVEPDPFVLIQKMMNGTFEEKEHRQND